MVVLPFSEPTAINDPRSSGSTVISGQSLTYTHQPVNGINVHAQFAIALNLYKLEYGPMPNVMAALPNIGGAPVQRRKVWLTPTTRMPCSNAAKTRNPLKFAGVPQTPEPISAVSGPKFIIL